MLFPNESGHYRFLQGIEPYSCGVIAEPGWEIVRVTTAGLLPPPWRAGFDLIDAHLRRLGLSRASLCAMELRSPAPFTMEGFIGYNRGYRALLEEWGLLLGGVNPIARTNVAPLTGAPSEVSLHAFSFVRPNPGLARRTFVVAGAGELREGILESHRILRRGDTSPAALMEKADYVLDVMEERLHGLGVGWEDVTATDVYTVHPLTEALRTLLLKRVGPAARHGLCWHVTNPPVLEIEFEMDVRGLAIEVQG